MTRIMDIHSHILPGLDDGAEDMQESIQMLDQAWRQGITEVVATPHYSFMYPNICPDRIRTLCREVQKRARQELDADIRIIPGQEIMYSEDVVDLLRAIFPLLRMRSGTGQCGLRAELKSSGGRGR